MESIKKPNLPEYLDIFFASKEGRLQQVGYVNSGEGVNKTDIYGNTPLYYACLCGHLNIVRYLLANGAHVDLSTPEGERCFLAALTDEIQAELQIYHTKNNAAQETEIPIASSGEKISATRIYVMRSAVITGNLEACINYEELIQERINKPDKRGFTFLDYAVFNDRFEVIEYLQKLGAEQTLPIYMEEVRMGEEHVSDVQFNIESQITGATGKEKAHAIILYCRAKRFLENYTEKTGHDNSNIVMTQMFGSSFWIPFTRFCRPKKIESPMLEIPVSDVEPDEFHNILKFIYSDNSFLPFEMASTIALLRNQYELNISNFLNFIVPYDINNVDHHVIMFSTLGNDYTQALNNPIGSDIVFVVEGRSLYAHKLFLSRYPAFRNLILGEKESSIIVIDDAPYEAFLHLLEYIYTDKIHRFKQDGRKSKREKSSHKPNEEIFPVKKLSEFCCDAIFRSGHLYQIADEEDIQVLTGALLSSSEFANRLSPLTKQLSSEKQVKLVLQLIRLAYRFEFPVVVEKCEFFLLGSYYPTIEDVISTFLICNEVQALRVRVRCFDFMVKYFGIVSLLEDFSLLTTPIQSAIKEKAGKRPPEQLADEKKLLNRLRATLFKPK